MFVKLLFEMSTVHGQQQSIFDTRKDVLVSESVEVIETEYAFNLRGLEPPMYNILNRLHCVSF